MSFFLYLRCTGNLDLRNNHLTSSIPTDIGSLALLGELFFTCVCSANQHFVTNALLALLHLFFVVETLSLRENELRGPIPSTISHLTLLSESLSYYTSIFARGMKP